MYKLLKAGRCSRKQGRIKNKQRLLINLQVMYSAKVQIVKAMPPGSEGMKLEF